MRHRGALLGIACVSGVAGCNFLISDWEVGGGAGGTSAVGGSVSSTTSSTANGAGGESPEGLQSADIEDGGVSVFREGFFRLDAKPDSAWQWFRWFDLKTEPDGLTSFAPTQYEPGASDFYRTTCLWTAYRARDGGEGANAGTFERSCEGSPDEEYVDADPPTRVDATPVWYSITASVDNYGQAEVLVGTRVYASGRVWTNASVQTLLDLSDQTPVGFGQFAVEEAGFRLTSSDEEGLIRRTSGGAILVVNAGDLDPDVTDWTEEAPWIHGGDFSSDDRGGIYEIERAVETDDVLTFIVPFHVGDGDDLAATRAARVADLRQPGLEAMSGATTLHANTGGLDPLTGAYDVDVDGGAPVVTLTLDASLKRFEPAFDLHGWTGDAWTIELDGQVIAKTGEEHPMVLAAAANGALSFQYLGVIEAGVAQAARTFTITAE